jgi:ribosome-associated toxin RatA of RatAB toxin-antitoxin module
MPAANRKEVFDAPIEKVYEVILDYESYPEFVDGVSEVKVIEQDEKGALVEYSLNMIKKFTYRLRLHHNRPNSVTWEFDSGDIFKVNRGHWKLKDLGDGRTEVDYEVELEVKIFAPKAIINKLATKSLPAMLQAYHQRAKSL